MTAVNIIRHESSVSMITDGAHLELDGRLGCRGSKVSAMPHLNAALAVRGGKFMGMILADQIGRTEKTYDEMKAGILGMTEAVEASVRPAWEKQFGKGVTDCDLFVAGISETTGPDSFAITRDKAYSPMGDAWTLVDLGAIALAPGTDPLHEKWAPQMSLSSFDARIAISLMNDQRRLIGLSRDGTGVHTVGCFAQLTTVQEGQIRSQIFHRWEEDLIGKLIRPVLTREIQAAEELNGPTAIRPASASASPSDALWRSG